MKLCELSATTKWLIWRDVGLDVVKPLFPASCLVAMGKTVREDVTAKAVFYVHSHANLGEGWEFSVSNYTQPL